MDCLYVRIGTIYFPKFVADPGVYDSLEALADVVSVEQHVDVCLKLQAGVRVELSTHQDHALWMDGENNS